MSALRDQAREAAAVLQGNRIPGADSLVFLDSAVVVEVAEAMERIRSAIPDLRDAVSDRVPNAFALKFLPDVGRRIWPRTAPDSGLFPTLRWQVADRDGRPQVGIPRLDSLNRSYHVAAVQLSMLGLRNDPDPWFEAIMVFKYYMNVPRLLAAYRDVPGITWVHELEPNTYTRTTVAAVPGQERSWEFDFREGRGDCPAGCTAAVNSVVRFNRDTKTVSLVRRDTIGRP